LETLQQSLKVGKQHHLLQHYMVKAVQVLLGKFSS